jgi:ATP-binding cassette subfamily B protein
MLKRSGFIKNSIKGIQIVFRHEPRKLIANNFISFLHGLSWILQVVFMQRFFDSAQNLVESNTTLLATFVALFLMIASYVFCQIMNGVDSCHAKILDLAVAKHINQNIFKKIASLNCLEFEDTERLDYINKAQNGGRNLVWVSLTLLDTFFFYTKYFLFMSIFLFTLNPVLILSVLAIFIPCLISNIIQIKTFRNLEDEAAPIRRESNYYESCACDIRETRLLGATEYFKQMFFSSLIHLNKLVFRAQLKKNITSLVFDAISIVGYGAILFMIFVLVLRQEISIGAFVAVLASIGRFFSFMNEVISERLRWASENVASVDNYISFVTENNDDFIKISHEGANIDIKNVSFAYPATNKYALNDISFLINKGETLAIVGENGSGKTTLCRLILGLYQPTKGEIFINNTPIKNVSFENWSAIYQNFCKYKMTLKENVAIGSFEKNTDDEYIKTICENSGVDLIDEKLTDGINTMLSRDFNGTEMSGGQWQRIAIARGIFRDSDFIILDEPTSAIDPIEETRMYNEFMDICKNKTAIIVTHRLGSVKIADRILVLKDGYITECGTHKELISQNGEYKRMYDMQSKWYVENQYNYATH